MIHESWNVQPQGFYTLSPCLLKVYNLNSAYLYKPWSMNLGISNLRALTLSYSLLQCLLLKY